MSRLCPVRSVDPVDGLGAVEVGQTLDAIATTVYTLDAGATTLITLDHNRSGGSRWPCQPWIKDKGRLGHGQAGLHSTVVMVVVLLLVMVLSKGLSKV